MTQEINWSTFLRASRHLLNIILLFSRASFVFAKALS